MSVLLLLLLVILAFNTILLKKNIITMQQNLQRKKGLVKSVFDAVYNKYDLMNDFMSFGVHRYWKRELIKLINPSANDTLVDVACGTGDIAKLFSDINQNQSKILCVDFNRKMLSEGKKRLKKLKNIKFFIGNAEKLNFKNNFFDKYVISFCLRNVTEYQLSLKEAYRVLKPGGKYCCLEFSTPKSSLISGSYKIYKSKILPLLGEIVANDKNAYEYLSESIDLFPSQEELSQNLEDCGFTKVETINLFNGIVAIHTGYKL